MNKACKECGLKQQGVHRRFKRHPELYNLVDHQAVVDDDRQEEEAAMDIEELDVSVYGNGRGRRLDLPEDMESALAKQIGLAISRLNAPTTRELLRVLVKEVCLLS